MHGITQPLNGVVAGTSTLVLAGSETRAYLLIQNRSAANQMFFNFGGPADSSNGIALAPGGAIEYVSRNFMPMGAVYLSGTAGQPFAILHC